MTASLDDLDQKILELLIEDPRQSYRSIAKSLNISHVNVSGRVKAMEEQGEIRGYTTILDPDLLGYYPLCLMITAFSGYGVSDIGKRIALHKSTWAVLRVSGECELLALAMCPDRESAIDLLNEFSHIKGIGKIESHVVLEAIKLDGKMLKT